MDLKKKSKKVSSSWNLFDPSLFYFYSKCVNIIADNHYNAKVCDAIALHMLKMDRWKIK